MSSRDLQVARPVAAPIHNEMCASRCPICTSREALSRRSRTARTRIFDCPACGPYEISGAALYDIVVMPLEERQVRLARAQQDPRTRCRLPLILLGPHDGEGSPPAFAVREELGTPCSPTLVSARDIARADKGR